MTSLQASAYLVMGNIPGYGKTFRSETEISSARALGGTYKLLNIVFISKSYTNAISVQNPMLKVEYFFLDLAKRCEFYDFIFFGYWC